MSLGDFAPGIVLYDKFLTFVGVPTTLLGTPVVSVYKDGSTTQSVTGVTLTVDFDGVTGLNHVAVDTGADGTFYSAGSKFEIVVMTGTVAGGSIVGHVVNTFTLNAVAALRPATAGRTLAADSSGNVTLSDSSLTTAKLGTFVLAKTTNITGFNDVSQTQITGGAYAISSASCVLGDARMANLDAAISTRSTLTQAQVTGGAYSIQSASCALGDARIANLDAAVSTRSTFAGGAVASVTGAVGSVAANVNTNANATETAIKAKTDNLPADPSSQAALVVYLTKVQAAVYDTATVVGSTITLSNGHTLTVTTGGRVLA